MYWWQHLVSRLTNNDLRVTEPKLQRHDLTRFLHYFCLLKELVSNVKVVHFTMGSNLLWCCTIYVKVKTEKAPKYEKISHLFWQLFLLCSVKIHSFVKIDGRFFSNLRGLLRKAELYLWKVKGHMLLGCRMEGPKRYLWPTQMVSNCF